MIERIICGDTELAIILRASFRSDGIEFFTPDDYSQQLGYMNRPAGYVIAPHLHKPVPRQVQFTNEVLLIKSGKLRADFYDAQQNYVVSKFICRGDVLLLASGGHGFEMIEPCEIIEVKQGPYAGEHDKLRFDPIEMSKLKF